MRIGINCGHTKEGIGSGAVGLLSESYETRNIGYKVMEYLKQQGHQITDCTIDQATSTGAYLARSVAMANSTDLDWFISIHLNAGGGQGVEVYTYAGRQYQDAVEVCRNLEELGFRNRGVKSGSGFYVIRKTNTKAMLIEVCFVDTQSDADLYRKLGIDSIAQAIANAIDSSIKGTVESPAPTQSIVPNKQETKGYIKVTSNTLNIRSSASWSSSAVCGSVRKNEVFTVVNKIVPSGSTTPLYELKSGVFVTSHPNYVTYYEK
ncbi:MAG: N-acetylmuramoyl-L-alanine amidase [Lachnospiraceae bacterium]